MTDKQIIETIKKLQAYCKDNAFDECKSCKFDVIVNGQNVCQIVALMETMNTAPATWNTTHLERIINETD